MSHTASRAEKQSEGGWGETISVILQALAIALVVRTLLFQPFNIPSGSMIPTLEVGDYLYTENIGAYSTASSTTFNGFEGARIIHTKSPASSVTEPEIAASGVNR